MKGTNGVSTKFLKGILYSSQGEHEQGQNLLDSLCL